MAGPNDPDSYDRAELEQRVRAGLDPGSSSPPPSRRGFGRILDFLEAVTRSLGHGR
ncbi:MAG: hypothetical protein AMXMBFR80_05950 [Dehalococcoidia bacterium]